MSLIHIFAINLKRYRKEQHGLSQEELADLANLHQNIYKCR